MSLNPQEFADFFEAYQLFKQMQQPQPSPIPAQPQVQGQVEVIHNSTQVGELEAQIAELKEQLAAAQLEIKNLTAQKEQAFHERDEAVGEMRAVKAENARLREDITKIEAWEAKSLEDILEEAGDVASGEEYYERMRHTFYEQGYTPREMHDKVAAYMDNFHPSEKDQDSQNEFIDFTDKQRTSVNRPSERIERGKKDHIVGNARGFVERMSEVGFDKNDDF